MTTLDALTQDPAILGLIVAIVLLAMVSRYLTARNERLLISIGEQNELRSSLRAWQLTAIVLFSTGIGLLVEARFESQNNDMTGVLLISAGLGIISYLGYHRVRQ